MLMMSIKNLATAFEEGNISFASFASQVGMMIPSFIQLTASAAALGAKIIANTSATTASTGAHVANTAAVIGETAAETAHAAVLTVVAALKALINKETLVGLAAIGLVIAAVWLLVKAVQFLTNLFSNWVKENTAAG